MPSYNLTQQSRDIITSWLYEPYGYLDLAVNDQGESAQQQLLLNPSLDVTEWIRTNTKGPGEQSDWDECSMLWWILTHDQINVPVPQLPAEAAAWAAILHSWDDSINAGFARVPQNERNTTAYILYNSSKQAWGSIPSGAYLAQQQQFISKVLAVLE